MIPKIKQDFPLIEELVLESDNASYLASRDNTIYMHYHNQNIDGIKVTNWLHTEACTGKGRLDDHFSYLNLKLKAHAIHVNEIRAEEDIYTAMTFENGLAGTTAILFDGSNVECPLLNKEFKMKKMGVHEKHEMLWTNE